MIPILHKEILYVLPKEGSVYNHTQDYQEMKTELGLDHFEGRSWRGWHHHVTLAAIAYAFLMLEKLGNKKNFWLDLASCPPIDPKVFALLYRNMPHLREKNQETPGEGNYS